MEQPTTDRTSTEGEPLDTHYGTRMRKLVAVLDKALDKSLAAVREKTLMECFPSLAASHPALLTRIHKDMIRTTRYNIKVRIVVIIPSMRSDGI